MSDIRGTTSELRGNDLVLTRRFEAPRHLVFRAWTTAESICQWFGPHGYISPECVIEPEVGGAYHLTMQGEDGEVHRMDYWIYELIPNEKLVIVDKTPDTSADILRQVNQSLRLGTDIDNIELQWTILFEDEGDGTKLTLICHAYTDEARELMRERGDNEGWAMIFEKLDSTLVRMRYKLHK